MTTSFKHLINVLRADICHLRGWLLVWIGLFILAGNIIIPALIARAPLPTPVFRMLTEPVFQSLAGVVWHFSFTALVAAVILAHPGNGPRMAWVTTPVPRGALTAAKLSFVVLLLVLPQALSRVVAGLWVAGSDPVLVLSTVLPQTLLLFLWAAIAGWISVQAAGFSGVLGRLVLAVAVFAVALVLGEYVTAILPGASSLDLAWVIPNFPWLLSVLLILAMIMGVWGVVLLHYRLRRRGLTLGLGLGLFLVMWLTVPSLTLNLPDVEPKMPDTIPRDLPIQKTNALTARWKVAGTEMVDLEFTLDPALLGVGEHPGSVTAFQGSVGSFEGGVGYLFGNVESVYGDLQRRRWLRQTFPGVEEHDAESSSSSAAAAGREAKAAEHFDLRIDDLNAGAFTGPDSEVWVQVIICRLEEVQRVPMGQVVRWREDGAPMAAWHEMGSLGYGSSFQVVERRYHFGWEQAPWFGVGSPGNCSSWIWRPSVYGRPNREIGRAPRGPTVWKQTIGSSA